MLNVKASSTLNSCIKGVTLLELMISVSIISILTVIAIPNYNDFIIKIRVDNEISQLHRMLLITRNTAINSGQKAIVCPLSNNDECSGQWENQLSVFIDSNDNKSLDDIENVLKIREAITDGDQLIYGKNRLMITFKPTGQLSGLANGTFRYCPKGYPNHARGIIVARSGRVYQSSDIDHDGIDENRGKTEINCE